MALVSCRECGQQVSSEASTCPQCGISRPVRAARTCLTCSRDIEIELEGSCPNCGEGDPFGLLRRTRKKAPQEHTGDRVAKWGLWLVLGLVGMSVLGTLVEPPPATDSRTSTTNTTRVTESSPPEAKLAAMDDDSRTVPTARIREFARLLDVLDRQCTQPRMRLSDMTLAARNELRSRFGKHVSILEMLTAEVNLVQGMGLGDLDCASVFSTLVLRLGRN